MPHLPRDLSMPEPVFFLTPFQLFLFGRFLSTHLHQVFLLYIPRGRLRSFSAIPIVGCLRTLALDPPPLASADVYPPLPPASPPSPLDMWGESHHFF